MAAPFLIALLLIAAAGTAGGYDGAMLPHLELPGTPDSGPAHESDALLELPGFPDLGRGHGSDAPPPPPQGLMDIMSTSGCGSFAALVAATPNASEVFEERIAAGGGGLTVFCPDDKAVVAFAPTFLALADKDRLAVLLHHGAAGRFVRPRFAGFDWVSLPTLAVADAATDKRQAVLARDSGDTIRLWPTWAEEKCEARVTKTVSSEENPLVLHVVDAVLLREKQDGGGVSAEAARGGYLRWLHYCVPLWWVLGHVVSVIVGSLGGAWLARREF